MHRQDLLTQLRNYHSPFIEEAGFVRRSIDYIAAHEDCFYRELWPMHVTGSSWVVSPDRSHVLMLHHKKHDQWFQPGGHADGQSDIIGVALRETMEETALDPSAIHLLSEHIFDVDIHHIPPIANDPPHRHIDVRFLIEVDDAIDVPGNDESHQVLWVPLEQVSRFNNNRSTWRMVQKTRRLRLQQNYRAAG